MPKVNRLEELEVYEVSMVPRGANKKKFYLYKSEMNEEEEMEEILKKLLEGKFENEEEVQKQLEELFKDSIEKADDADSAVAAVKAIMKLMQTVKGQVSEEKQADVMGAVAKLAGFEPEAKKKKKEGEEEDDDLDPEMEKEKKRLESEKAAKKKTKKEGDVPKDKVEPSVEEKLDALWKKNEKLEEENVKLTKSIDEEVEKRITKEFKEKAEGFGNLGASQDDVASLLKAAYKSLSKEEYSKLEKTLKSASTLVEKGELLAEKGSNATPVGESAYSEIKKAAIKKRAENTDLSEEEAFDAVLTENPELYTRYEEESQGGQ